MTVGRASVHSTRALEEAHAGDLAMAALIDGEGVERAVYFARRYFDHFLTRWSSLHPLVTGVRHRCVRARPAHAGAAVHATAHC